MASFQKRGDRWQYTISRYVDGVYKPIRKGGFRTKREAEIEATQIEDELYRGVYKEIEDIAFSDYFSDWLDIYKSNISNNTKSRYLNTYNTINDYFGYKPIQNITNRKYQIFINEYSKDRANATVKKLNSHIRACVRTAIKEGIIQSDFTEDVSLGGRRRDTRVDKFLDHEDTLNLHKYVLSKINQMFKEAKHFEPAFDLRYFIILLAITTGMRFGEIIALKFDDFNFEKKYLRINKTFGYTKNMAKGFSNTKTREARTIKLDSHTTEVFKKLKPYIYRNEYNIIFYNRESKYKVVTNTSVNNLLKEILVRLNASNTNLSIHGLRHTHASILLYFGVSILYVSERLGHSNVETTYEHYSHLIKELRDKDQEKTIKIFN